MIRTDKPHVNAVIEQAFARTVIEMMKNGQLFHQGWRIGEQLQVQDCACWQYVCFAFRNETPADGHKGH